jgi:spore maturation protein CgeB
MATLKEHFKYKKFNRDQFRILFLDQKYFLQEQSVQCMKNFGHQIRILPVKGDPSKMLDTILRVAVEFKPDCIMTMNHQGFDRDGQIISILDDLKVPVLIWYLDDFRFILPNFDTQARENTLIFSFEKKNIAEFHELGFKHAFYMPTATILDPRSSYEYTNSNDLENFIVFIGNSFEETKNKWFKPGYNQYYINLKPLLKDGNIGNELFTNIQNAQGSLFSSSAELFHFCGYVTAQETQIYRKEMLSSFKDDELIVFGDNHWKTILKGISVRKGVHQAKEAPGIYRKAAVNLNLSSVQLDTSANMRIYDVPASGGFLLSDYKESLFELFDENTEIVVFHEKNEMLDKAAFYKQHQSKREKIVAAARERVQKEHLLEHRIHKILEKAREVYKNY